MIVSLCGQRVVVLSGNRNDTKADIIIKMAYMIYITHAYAKYNNALLA